VKVKKPSFKLISCTESPIETLFAAWAQSRPTQYPELFKWLNETYGGSVITARLAKEALIAGIVDEADMKSTIKSVAAMSLPITEEIHFTWGFSNLPIEWREQAVRKRQWAFWLTSMREFGMDDFAEDGRFCPPPEGTVSPDSIDRFCGMIEVIQSFYRELQEDWGWKPEVARKVIPLCATHNGTMSSNYRTLMDTASSRTCWIAQIDVWAPVILGFVESLREIDPLFGAITTPPCFKKYENEFNGCKYELINENRCSGKDVYAPCPLYLCNQEVQGMAFDKHQYNYQERCRQLMVGEKFINDAMRLIDVWKKIWNRDPFTGKILE